MIICTEHVLTVGQRCCGPVNDANLIPHIVAFVVLRETDEAEYLAHVAELSQCENPPFDRPMQFYEVAMD